MKSTFKTIGRILIIFAVAALIVGGLSLLTSSTGDTTTMQQPPAFDASMAANMPVRPEHDEGGASAFGLLELVKNIAVMGTIITVYWFGQKWLHLTKRQPAL